MCILGQECLECLLCVVKVLRCKAPHIHTHWGVECDFYIFAIFALVADMSILVLNRCTFYHIGQEVVGICATYAAAHTTVLAEGIAYAITCHAVFALFSLNLIEELSHYLKGLFAVEVISIDDHKWLIDTTFSHQNGMVSTPRFGALWVACKALWQVVNALEANFALYVVSILAENDITEVLFKILADDKYHLAKTSTHSVKHAIVHDGFTIRSEAIQLFQATVTATHTSSQNK